MGDHRLRCGRTVEPVGFYADVISDALSLEGTVDSEEAFSVMEALRQEQLVAELLERMGYSVRGVPVGKDHGIDVIASSQEQDFLIDVNRYQAPNLISVELVRKTL